MSVHEYIVVGSGPSGVHAALTLIEAGKEVLMIDTGITSSAETDFPEKNFIGLRKTYHDQYKIWLGDRFEGIPSGNVHAGQLTPQRQFIHHSTETLAPFISETFLPLESFARGGMGSAWGLGCFAFSDEELRQCGLPVKEMNAAYQVIADRIGISYTPDDVEKFISKNIQGLQPGIKLDENADALLSAYTARKHSINKKGFYLGRSCLALLTREKNGRNPTNYDEMDYYTNTGKSAWRPELTLNGLKQNKKFTYRDKLFVRSFSEVQDLITVHAASIPGNDPLNFRCKKLILACNVFSTARIVADAHDGFVHRFPLLSNPNYYMPCLQWKIRSSAFSDTRSALAQLMLFQDSTGKDVDIALASVFSYRSLMLFRLMNSLPINHKDSLKILRSLVPHLVIVGINYPDEPSDNKYFQVSNSGNRNEKSVINIEYVPEESELIKQRERNKEFGKILFQLGCLPLKNIRRVPGSNHHYAGATPYNEKEIPFHLQPNGRLSTTKNVFIADGSGFRFLPAKGLTFTLMANAHRTALNAMK